MFAPIIVLLIPVVTPLPELYPKPTLLLPVVKSPRAVEPTAVIWEAVLINQAASYPHPVLLLPVLPKEFPAKANAPVAVLFWPVVKYLKAPQPNAAF